MMKVPTGFNEPMLLACDADGKESETVLGMLENRARTGRGEDANTSMRALHAVELAVLSQISQYIGNIRR